MHIVMCLHASLALLNTSSLKDIQSYTATYKEKMCKQETTHCAKETCTTCNSEPNLPHKIWCNISDFLKRTFDLRLFVNAYVLLFLMCSLCVSTSFSAPYVFLPEKCYSDGISKQATAFIISMMGVGDITGKIIFGFMGYQVNTTLVCVVGTIIAGLGIISNGLSHTFKTVLASSFMNFGLGMFNHVAPMHDDNVLHIHRNQLAWPSSSAEFKDSNLI